MIYSSSLHQSKFITKREELLTHYIHEGLISSILNFPRSFRSSTLQTPSQLIISFQFLIWHYSCDFIYCLHYVFINTVICHLSDMISFGCPCSWLFAFIFSSSLFAFLFIYIYMFYYIAIAFRFALIFT